VGKPRLCYVADIRRRPKLDRGSPRRTRGNAVPNPRIRACKPSSKVLPPALRSHYEPHPAQQECEPVPLPIDCEHKSTKSSTVIWKVDYFSVISIGYEISRGRLKIYCRETCWFESGPGRHPIISMSYGGRRGRVDDARWRGAGKNPLESNPTSLAQKSDASAVQQRSLGGVQASATFVPPTGPSQRARWGDSRP